jgi:hypothetical protein
MSGIRMNAKVGMREKESVQRTGFVEESGMTRLMGLAIGGIGFFLVALKLLNPY